MRRFFVGLIVVIVAGSVAWRLLRTPASQGGMGPRGRPPIAVRCESVTVGDVEDVAEFTGTLAGEAEVLVSPKIAGRVNTIQVELGDQVAAGQLLATLDDAEAQHAVAEANAKLAVARASLEECQANLVTAQRELDRVTTLRQRGVAADKEFETAQTTVSALLAREKVSEASIHQQEAALRAAQARLDYTEIKAPIDGFVGKRFVDEGAMISSSTPIILLADLNPVKTVISVVEQDYAKIRVGLTAMLTVDTYPDQSFEGRASRIAPVVDRDTRTAEVEIEVPNGDLLLKPGMFTRVRIHLGTHRGVPLIPTRALVKREEDQGIFVPSEDGTEARFVSLQPGISTADYTEVTGLEEGQSIIVMGQHLLQDGYKIIVTTPAESSSS